MSNYWVAMTDYTRENGSIGSCSSAANSLTDAISRGFETASYYLLECGYPRAVVTAEEFCGSCHGTGEIVVRRPRSVKHVKCRDCKGHEGPLQTLGPIPVVIHENAKHRCEPAVA